MQGTGWELLPAWAVEHRHRTPAVQRVTLAELLGHANRLLTARAGLDLVQQAQVEMAWKFAFADHCQVPSCTDSTLAQPNPNIL